MVAVEVAEARERHALVVEQGDLRAGRRSVAGG